MSSQVPEVSRQLSELAPKDDDYAIHFVDRLLDAARRVGVSDIHLQPGPHGLDTRWRLDGVLQQLGTFPSGESADVVARLKVLAELLTYRTDVPQEGRLRRDNESVEMRLSTFPTLHGERAVIRLFAPDRRLQYLTDLGLPEEIERELRQSLSETSGGIVVCGPAGSGKTTTVYAALRELVGMAGGHKCVVTLEDPIEVALPDVAQSQVKPAVGFDLATGLRSLMRQDPEVILVGEIRDPETAEAAFQAALTGHLLLTTFHAGSAAGAISRLSDMGIEPYLLRTGILSILCQRLVRRLCDCAQPVDDPAEFLGLHVEQARRAAGCPDCFGTGYRGRLVIAEMLRAQPDEVGRAILSRCDASQLEAAAVQAGMVTRWRRAEVAVEDGRTSPGEIRRVLGLSKPEREPSTDIGPE